MNHEHVTPEDETPETEDECLWCGLPRSHWKHEPDEPDPEIDIDGSLADREADRYERFLDSMQP